MKKISIIVPVYKVELYLNRCIDSILNQTFKNFELILVNDGSPDRCGEICEEYALKDKRVKVIHQKNEGQSSARNRGLDIACGEYIGFVDSDDWIEVNMYKRLYELVVKNNVDIGICGFNLIQKNIPLEKFENFSEKVIIKRGKKEVLLSRYEDNFLGWGPCNKLYKKEVLKNIRFLNGRIYEDVPFNIEVFNKITSYVYTNDKLYNYMQFGESTTRSKITKRHLSLLYNTFYCYEKTDVKFKQITLNNILNNCKFICDSIIGEKTILKNRVLLNELHKILLDNKELIVKIKYKKIINRLEFNLIKLNPFLYCIFYRIEKDIKLLLKNFYKKVIIKK